MINSCSNSSGKHSMEGLNNATNSSGSGGEVLGGGDMGMKSDNCKDGTKKKYLNYQTLR